MSSVRNQSKSHYPDSEGTEVSSISIGHVIRVKIFSFVIPSDSCSVRIRIVEIFTLKV